MEFSHEVVWGGPLRVPLSTALKRKESGRDSHDNCQRPVDEEDKRGSSQMSQWWFSSLLDEENGRQEQSHDNCQKWADKGGGGEDLRKVWQERKFSHDLSNEPMVVLLIAWWREWMAGTAVSWQLSKMSRWRRRRRSSPPEGVTRGEAIIIIIISWQFSNGSRRKRRWRWRRSPPEGVTREGGHYHHHYLMTIFKGEQMKEERRRRSPPEGVTREGGQEVAVCSRQLASSRIILGPSSTNNLGNFCYCAPLFFLLGEGQHWNIFCTGWNLTSCM